MREETAWCMIEDEDEDDDEDELDSNGAKADGWREVAGSGIPRRQT